MKKAKSIHSHIAHCFKFINPGQQTKMRNESLVELVERTNILKGKCNKQKVYTTKDREVIQRMGNILNIFYLFF